MPKIKEFIQFFIAEGKGENSWNELARRFSFENGEKLRTYVRHNSNKFSKIISEEEPAPNYDKIYYKGDSCSIEKKILRDIRNESELIEACNIDTDKWLVSSWKCSSWESPSKDGESKRLYAVSVELKKKDASSLEYYFSSLSERLCSTIPPIYIKRKVDNEKSLFLYTSDKHIGALTKKSSIYKNDYTAEIFRNRLLSLLDEIQYQFELYGRFDTIHFVDLGDALDGFNAKTTRGGHTLPQNLSNEEQFDVFVNVHKEFFDSLVKMDVTNNIKYLATYKDNHSGSFSYFANRALQIYLNHCYPDIETIILDKFIEHYYYGKHCFLFTHGKDEEDMKHGFPFHLTDKVENYINDYINYFNIKADAIHVIKGDLHRSASEEARRFRYKNVMSVYGGSKWIHTNFGTCKAGINFDIVWKNEGRVLEQKITF